MKRLISIFRKYSDRLQTPAHQKSEQNYAVMTLTNRAVKQLKESNYNYMLLIREFSAHSNFCNNDIKKRFYYKQKKEI